MCQYPGIEWSRGECKNVNRQAENVLERDIKIIITIYYIVTHVVINTCQMMYYHNDDTRVVT